MLRITITENGQEQTWVLQGRLTKRSVAELVASWKAQPAGRSRIVDLNEVTSIDKSGEEVLWMMVHDGAPFLACGVCRQDTRMNVPARRADWGFLREFDVPGEKVSRKIAAREASSLK